MKLKATLLILASMFATSVFATEQTLCEDHVDKSTKEDIKFVKSISGKDRLMMMVEGFGGDCRANGGTSSVPTDKDLGLNKITMICTYQPSGNSGFVSLSMKIYLIDKSGHLLMNDPNEKKCFTPMDFEVEAYGLRLAHKS